MGESREVTLLAAHDSQPTLNSRSIYIDNQPNRGCQLPSIPCLSTCPIHTTRRGSHHQPWDYDKVLMIATDSGIVAQLLQGLDLIGHNQYFKYISLTN